MRRLLIILLSFSSLVEASNPVVNVTAWGGVIPKKVIQKFEATTGIHVNFSTYDTNETLYAKLRATPGAIYDVILPSSYLVDRLKRQGMLMSLNHQKLTQLKYLDPLFTHDAIDPDSQYSVPLIWGATGIFYNRAQIPHPPTTWAELWDPRFKNKLLLLDDSREIMSIALMSLGYSPNDQEATHLHAAFNKLLTLVPNVKLFSTEGIQALLIDEDASIGVVWNGDVVKAHDENPDARFIYPKDGFVIWVDCLAIPADAPHQKEAHAFINFMLTPSIAATMARTQGHAITNKAGLAMLPEAIRNNPMIYPSERILAHGYFQRDPGDDTIALFNQYWQQLKLAF